MTTTLTQINYSVDHTEADESRQAAADAKVLADVAESALEAATEHLADVTTETKKGGSTVAKFGNAKLGLEVAQLRADYATAVAGIAERSIMSTDVALAEVVADVVAANLTHLDTVTVSNRGPLEPLSGYAAWITQMVASIESYGGTLSSEPLDGNRSRGLTLEVHQPAGRSQRLDWDSLEDALVRADVHVSQGSTVFTSERDGVMVDTVEFAVTSAYARLPIVPDAVAAVRDFHFDHVVTRYLTAANPVMSTKARGEGTVTEVLNVGQDPDGNTVVKAKLRASGTRDGLSADQIDGAMRAAAEHLVDRAHLHVGRCTSVTGISVQSLYGQAVATFTAEFVSK